MNISKQITAAIIAGGESRRFGASKALASFGSKTLLQRSIDLAKLLTPDVMVVTGRVEQIPNPGIRMVSDLVPGCGPLGGIHAALSHTQNEWVITLPCDMPLLIPEIYTHLLQARKGTQPVVAVSHKGPEPLVAIWPKEAAQIIEKNLTQNHLSICNTLQELNAVYTDMQRVLQAYHPEIFSNINYPDDLRSLESQQEVFYDG